MFDDVYLSLPCPKCSKETKKTLRWVKAHTAFVCDHCGAEVTLDKSKFTEPMAQIDKEP